MAPPEVAPLDPELPAVLVEVLVPVELEELLAVAELVPVELLAASDELALDEELALVALAASEELLALLPEVPCVDP